MSFRVIPILLALAAAALPSHGRAQSIQDCDGAIRVCGLNYVQNLLTPGYGVVQELHYPSGNNPCLAAGEQNSTWYIFNVATAGNLEFTVTPNTPTDDYDWAVYDITNTGCAGISAGTAPPVACNYSVFPGPTGMSPTGSGNTADPLEPNFCAPQTVQANGTYALVVNNSTLSNSGYAIQFGGTANLLDNVVPQPSVIAHRPCDQVDTLYVTLTDYVDCNTVDPDGSDFSFTGPSPFFGHVTAAEPVNCNANNFTNQVKIALSQLIEFNGTYTLTVNNGLDGNTMLDVCGNATPPGSSINFTVDNVPTVDLGLDTSICDGEVLLLDAGNPGLNYHWSSGETTQTIKVTAVPTTVNVFVDRDGCYATDSIHVGSACQIFVPNAFSPNGDGLNDVFGYISTHVKEAEVTVYNRWGQRVFYSTVEKDQWDGTDGWDVRYPAGVYVYIIRGTYRSGKPFNLVGNVSLIR